MAGVLSWIDEMDFYGIAMLASIRPLIGYRSVVSSYANGKEIKGGESYAGGPIIAPVCEELEDAWI
jgi:hypothetical protein